MGGVGGERYVDKRDEDALEAVKLYYRNGLSQAQVAKELGVSRPTVAKLIQHGRAKGFVSIEIHDPRETSSELGDRLQERFGLQEAVVTYRSTTACADVLEEIGRAGAELLSHLVRDGMSVGISWGQTMYSIAEHLKPRTLCDIDVVQLKGGSSHSDHSTLDFETLYLFCQALNGTAHPLPLPVVFDDVRTKNVVEADRHIAEILDMGRNTDLVVFTVGSVQPSSLLLNLGYFTEKQKEELLSRAVGDACSRFYTRTGEIAVPSIDKVTVGITLEELATRPLRLLVAGGMRKVEAIYTALKMGLATHLVTDRPTATRILRHR
ncbi:sugar-binding transcriptional regulator [Actinobaculum suis]|uniref:sugar-binding transcriptional regulator n=2 Tax=Actinobaculum suis TaxID=1657 RepID=UPI00210032FA|nr:sugar-binding transcriptional regulator [Actinobaculum suis]